MQLHRITVARRNAPATDYYLAQVLILARDRSAAEVAVARQARGIVGKDDPHITFVVYDGVVDPDQVIVLNTDTRSPIAPIFGALSVAQLLAQPTATPASAPQVVEPIPKGYIVIDKELLAQAIFTNTDASLAEARHIINTTLKVSDSPVYRAAGDEA